MNHDIPIIRKCYELYIVFYGCLKLFPQRDRYALGGKCEQYLIIVLELLLDAGSIPREQKASRLQEASVKFDALKFFLRLCCDLKILDQKKYIALQTHIQEIGRMLGGWQRSLN